MLSSAWYILYAVTDKKSMQKMTICKNGPLRGAIETDLFLAGKSHPVTVGGELGSFILKGCIST